MGELSLLIPDDEIGWTDETFEAAIAYVSLHTNILEAHAMADWIREHIKPGNDWYLATHVVRPSYFKSHELGAFRYFSPSNLQAAFDEIKQTPGLTQQSKIAYETAKSYFAIFVITVTALGLIIWMLARM